MIGVNAGPLASFFRRESSWDRVRKPLSRVVTAGATVVVVSAASAAASAARRRKESA